MLRRTGPLLKATLFAGAAFFLANGEARAGDRVHAPSGQKVSPARDNRGGSYDYRLGSYNGQRGSFDYRLNSPKPAAAPAVVTRQANYPPDRTEVATMARTPSPRKGNGVVRIKIKVPRDAEIWFDGVKTTQTGSAREFVTPSLSRGKVFTYRLRVRWLENGRAVIKTRKITVRSGGLKKLTFSKPAPRKHLVTGPKED
jgi:uncharacterized protein (TIGR03000 family)